MNSIELNVAKWFTGKSAEKATEALNLLNESMELGYWVARGSVKVPAALSKSNVAQKASKSAQQGSRSYESPDYRIAFVMYYGQLSHLQDTDATSDSDLAKMFNDYKEDFKAVCEAIEYLNAESKNNKALAESDDTNPIGICACCFRPQRVKPSGTMYNHGYRRPGFGFILGGCPGEQFPPYAVK